MGGGPELPANVQDALKGTVYGAEYHGVVVRSFSNLKEPKSLRYPAVPAPDTAETYYNWHRLNIGLIWLPAWIGTWRTIQRPKPREENGIWARNIEWARYPFFATQTWLVRRNLLYRAVRKVPGNFYITAAPNQVRMVEERWDGMSTPAETYPISPSGMPLKGWEEVLAPSIVIMNVWGNWAVMPHRIVVGAAAGFDTPRYKLGDVLRTPGYQFILNNMIRGLVGHNPLMKQTFEVDGMWIEQVPAPAPRPARRWERAAVPVHGR